MPLSGRRGQADGQIDGPPKADPDSGLMVLRYRQDVSQSGLLQACPQLGIAAIDLMLVGSRAHVSAGVMLLRRGPAREHPQGVLGGGAGFGGVGQEHETWI
jgi:hypothetical protein